MEIRKKFITKALLTESTYHDVLQTLQSLTWKYHIHMKEKQLLHSAKLLPTRIAMLRMTLTFFILTLFIAMATGAAQSQQQPLPGTTSNSPCSLTPVAVPVLPDKIPGYTELDPDTQLHVTGTAQVIDLENYALEITGEVKQTLTLKYDDLRCMPKVESRPTLVCPGFFEDTATWAGASLKYLLELVDVQKEATHIRLVSADGYTTLVEIQEALSGKSFLAYEWEGKAIPILHGFPVRAIFPESNGNKWVKWLVRIEVQ